MARGGEYASQQRMRQVVRQLARHARVAYRESGSWADDVRWDAEDRMGLGPEDEAVLDDPEYGAALDVFAELRELSERATGLSRGIFG